MRYFNLTMKYLQKNWWKLLPLFLVCSALLSVTFFPINFLSFLMEYPNVSLNYFGEFFILISGFKGLNWLWRTLALIASFALCSYFISIIDRHFKTGSLSYRSPIHCVNLSFVPVLITGLFILLGSLACRFLLTCFITVIHYFLANGSQASTLSIVFVVIISLIIYCVMIVTVMPLTLLLPSMMIAGYSFGDAVTFSLRIFAEHFGKILIGVLFPLLITDFIYFLVVLLGANKIWLLVVTIVNTLFLLMYYLSFVLVSYYDIADIERRDTIKKRY